MSKRRRYTLTRDRSSYPRRAATGSQLRELHFPVHAVYDNDGNFEVAFPSAEAAADYVRDHR